MKKTGLFLCLLLGLAAAHADGPAVIVDSVKLQPVEYSDAVVGRVVAAKRADVMPRVSGMLLQGLSNEGALVKKGDLLFRIDPEPFEIQVAQANAGLLNARAVLKQAEAELKRVQTLRRSSAASQSDLDTAEANRDVAKAQVAAADAQLKEAKLNQSYTYVRSPLDGRVGKAEVTEGNLVTANTTFLTSVVQTHPVYVEMSVSSGDLLKRQRETGLPKQNEVYAELTLSSGETFNEKGEFNYLSPEVNRQTDTLLVRAVFANENNQLIPGEFVRMRAGQVEPEKILMVKQKAVQRDKEGYFVLVVDDKNTVSLRRVELGRKYNSLWAVKSGLQEGERIITEGLQKVRVGDSVSAREE